jgi:hypothetical protein
MSNPPIIIKIHDYYLEWGKSTDRPISYGMKLEEFQKYYLETYREQPGA